MALQVDELLDLVELSVHLQDGDVLSVVGIRSVEHLDAREATSQLASTRHPRNRASLVEEVGRVEQFLALLLDQAHTEDLTLLLVRDELGRQNLDDDVSLLLLRVDVGVEVRLPGVDGGLDALKGVSTLCHIALDLPGELDLVGDVEVDAEVDQVVDTVIVEGVKSLDDENLRRVGLLRRVKQSGDVVVDGLVDRLSRLEGLDLLVHEVEVLGLRGEGGDLVWDQSVSIVRIVRQMGEWVDGWLALCPPSIPAILIKIIRATYLRDLPSFAVEAVVVVKANDGRHVGDERVAVRVSSRRRLGVSSEDSGHTTHEGPVVIRGSHGSSEMVSW